MSDDEFSAAPEQPIDPTQRSYSPGELWRHRSHHHDNGEAELNAPLVLDDSVAAAAEDVVGVLPLAADETLDEAAGSALPADHSVADGEGNDATASAELSEELPAQDHSAPVGEVAEENAEAELRDLLDPTSEADAAAETEASHVEPSAEETSDLSVDTVVTDSVVEDAELAATEAAIAVEQQPAVALESETTEAVAAEESAPATDTANESPTSSHSESGTENAAESEATPSGEVSVGDTALEAEQDASDHTPIAESVEEETSNDSEESEAEAPVHTTTIPVASAEDIDNFEPSEMVPEDVLEARDSDNPPTSAIRRDLMATPQAEEPAAPSWEEALASSAPATREVSAPTPSGQTPASLDDAIFEGATVVPVVPSRTGSHVMSLLFGLLLIPAGWYLFADASARMLFPEDAPVMSGNVSWLALIEFASALLVWAIFLMLTLRSSLGAWVWGIVLTICGLPWLVAPGVMLPLAENALSWLETSGGVLGQNLYHHIMLDAFSGRFLALGCGLLSLAIVAVSVRKRGRAEEAVRAQVEKVNPDGAFLSRSERRRAAKRKH